MSLTMSMNIRTLIGAACANPNFKDQLMADPQAAALSIGISLSPDELTCMNNIVNTGKGNGLFDAMMDVNRKVCPPGGVCPW